MADDRIALPSAEEMLKRLRSVMDEPHAVANLYPKITAHAGQRKAREGVEMLVLLAIYDYAGAYPEAVAAALQVALPRFVSVLTEGQEHDRG